MKIIIVTDAWYPQVNGVVRTLDETSKQLIKLGHEVKLISPEGFFTIPCPTYPEIKLSLFPGAKVSSMIREFNPDCLHISTEGPLGLAARAYASRNSLAFTSAYHTRFPEYVHARIKLPLKITYAFLRWFHSRSELVMVPTEEVKKDLLKYKIGNPQIWARGVDLEIFKPKKGRRKNKNPILLNVGRVSVEKNLEEFLKIDLPYDKWVVGDGPALKELKKKYPKVIFHGAKSKEELKYYYNKADVFVFPSKTDTFGLVLLEAMACGLPVAALPVSGPLDVIGNSDAGNLNLNLKEAIKKALLIPRKVAREYAKTFSWEITSRTFETYLVRIRDKDTTYNIEDNPHKGNTGITRVLHAAKNSWSGLVFAIREESAFRQEMILVLVSFLILLLSETSVIEKILMIFATSLVLIIELLNSSVEAAVDRISFEYHGLSKRAKDYGSAAVMLSLFLWTLIHGLVLFN
ncbi:MAG: diacylglycerol kinase [Alphaproteobacteria bacterium]|nr:diacylglycerol kinase [Alphaproteobacteria bacterium]